MKVLAVMGSPRKNGNTKKFVEKFESELKGLGVVEFEYLYLADCDLKICRGCMNCYAKGEDACPLKDDHDKIAKKLLESEGVVFMSPTYVANMSALLKNFFDRFSYYCHRIDLAGRKAVLFTSAGGSGSGMALRNMFVPVLSMGYRTYGMIGVGHLKWKNLERYRKSVDRRIAKVARKFYRALLDTKPLRPNALELNMFRMRQKEFPNLLDPAYTYDRQYYFDKGWNDRRTKYYYPVRIGVFTRIGAFFMGLVMKFFN